MVSDSKRGRYWTNNGKFQKDRAYLEGYACDYGFTPSEYINAFMGMCRIYYAIHNDSFEGNESFSDSMLMTRVRPVMGDNFGDLYRMSLDSDYLEDMMDEVIAECMKHNVAYPIIIAHVNNRTCLYSMSSPFEGSYRVTFGFRSELEEYVSGYTLLGSGKGLRY